MSSITYLGKTKVDKTGRISLIKEVSSRMDVSTGDYVGYYLIDGHIVLSGTPVLSFPQYPEIDVKEVSQ